MTNPQKTEKKGQLSPGTWQERKSQIKHKWVKPFVWLEWLLFSKPSPLLSEHQPVFKFFQLIAYLWIMYGILIYYQGKDDRIKQRQYQAWQIINLAQGKTGSGGRIQALEELNKDHVSLEGIDVTEAYLVGIKLPATERWRAHLQCANFRKANLQNAKLQGADLREADLSKVNLQGANLQKANLKKANLQGVDLREADLQEADLQEADLLEGDYLRVYNLRTADLDLAFINDEKAIYFQGANLQKANLKKANLQGANLRGVDLRGAKNITVEQLSRVKTMYKAKLDPKIEEQIREKYPHLLEEPKDVKENKSKDPN